MASSTLLIIKVLSMIIMFSLIMITALNCYCIKLERKKFRTSTKLISLASAFSGGLFIAVGILHLLPESKEGFDDYYNSIGVAPDDQFPWPNFICVLCFAFVLYIEKVAFASYISHDANHNHPHGHRHPENEEHTHIPLGLVSKKNETQNKEVLLDVPKKAEMEEKVDNEEDEIQEAAQRKRIRLKKQKVSINYFCLLENMKGEPKISKLTPYILQVAIGIHATFEGMAIGLEDNVASCIGIALAVVCHKWAEGLTLGIAFFKADVDLKMATIMIAIQAIMNPIGIMIGWILSNQGDVVRGIFEAISAGTFVYIASAEVIVNEFNLKRYRFFKFFLFLIAIGFVTSLFFIEQATGA